LRLKRESEQQAFSCVLTPGINAARNNNSAISKQIAKLENRLDKSRKKYNAGVTRNEQLRVLIDTQRREQDFFTQVTTANRILERNTKQDDRHPAERVDLFCAYNAE